MVKDLDMGGNGDCLGRFIRARVEVDITKSVERGFDLDVGEDETVPIFVKYERVKLLL